MPGIDVQLPPPPPPGLNYISSIQLSLNSILAITPLGVILVPMIIILFVFTPSKLRRTPIFILNIFACCSGILEATLNAILEVRQMIYPLEPVSHGLLTSVVVFSVGSPVFVDSILLLRILAFYPISITPKRTLAAIFAFPLIVKCARLAVVVVYVVLFVRKTRNAPSVFTAAESIWERNPLILSEWTLQMLDNAYASLFFLYRIWEFRRSRQLEGHQVKSNSFLSYLRSLFLVALGNLVFPVIMNIAAIVLMASDPSYITGSQVLMANNYVAIIGVVFATIWARKQSWNREGRSNHQRRKERLANDSSLTHDTVFNSRSLISTVRFGRNPGIREQDSTFSNANATTVTQLGTTMEEISESGESDERSSKISPQSLVSYQREKGETL
ncbi:hypothetical protein P691DRAFT_800828 [Macrolepiota fuliginosa MF-IS2]|uniref:Uncharacterized protein n=1 Tax=Macrolepiota fuliginosa MF-IS2 TaxID=1400762 RepID=A0A9P5XBQ7_9AGAR|nr:hypothetical protein P691DRAFT_800828 [Macrolepiota fuliginosa MF-IS2]